MITLALLAAAGAVWAVLEGSTNGLAIALGVLGGALLVMFVP